MSGRKRAIVDRTLEREIGQRVKAARCEREVSQETLGAQLGVTFQQVQKYENGSNRVSATTLKKIAAFLKVDPFELLYGSERMDQVVAFETVDRNIARAAAALDEAGKRSVLTVIRAIVSATRGEQAATAPAAIAEPLIAQH